MGLERTLRTIFYPLIFLIVVLGYHTQWVWFRWVGAIILVYGIWRFVSVPCWHRHLAYITGIWLLLITFMKVDNVFFAAILGILMLLDIIPM